MSAIAQFVVVSFGTRYTISLISRAMARAKVHTSTVISKDELAKLRKEYSDQPLLENDSSVAKGPEQLFATWLNEAKAMDLLEPNAMCLSTCENNKPSARFVLLKTLDERGFVWFSNYSSLKGQQLKANPQAALTFFWGPLERQVRVEGRVEMVSKEESDNYFSIRPRASQLGAWSSDQSNTIPSRSDLDKQAQAMHDKFAKADKIPRPEHWGGYRLVPHKIEFWKGRSNRLHDRIVFQRSDESNSSWSASRLQP